MLVPLQYLLSDERAIHCSRHALSGIVIVMQLFSGEVLLNQTRTWQTSMFAPVSAVNRHCDVGHDLVEISFLADYDHGPRTQCGAVCFIHSRTQYGLADYITQQLAACKKKALA